MERLDLNEISAPTASAAGLPLEIASIYRNIIGNMYLSPKVIRFLIFKECVDKLSCETYRQYMERLRGNSFSNKEWKDACRTSRQVLETDRNPDKLDVTDLSCLLENILVLRENNGTRDFSEVLNKVRVVKNLRNEIMHKFEAMVDPRKFIDLTAALLELIREAGRFYSLLPAEVEAEEKVLNSEIANLLVIDKTSLFYCCSRLAMFGKQAVRLLWEARLTSEVLILSNVKVQRQAVFHALELMVRASAGGKVIPYTEIFETSEKFLVVTGVAGAGKTTLVQNIVLHFFELQEGDADYLRPISQVVLFECRDRYSETLSDVIEQHFEDLCSDFGNKIVLKALLRLDVLFIIDGFDEVHDISLKVVAEILAKTWRSNCRVLITTRPHGLKKLQPILLSKNCCFSEFEIMPLAKLEDQLAFLRRYEESLSEFSQVGEMARSFSSLKEDVRSLFTEPINLMHFCDVYKYMPEKIPSWQTPGDVARDILSLYKRLVEIKLLDSNYCDSEDMIEDLFAVIGSTALELLHNNIVTLSEENCQYLKRQCKLVLKRANTTCKIDPEIVLSVVLKMCRPLSGKRFVSYSFPHKTVQEMFAAESIVRRIQDSGDSINTILGNMSKKIAQNGDRDSSFAPLKRTEQNSEQRHPLQP
ncbi:uncharacterized protein LOC125179613 [Hyalella azteca]|uniref:Uncharacterized protein LOC125179613 n=1 Tax=Hyalella azteca TaxID=294128 RepID=A0A979FYF1_HYAAZ|nr:uncharacterized protein LOC125179613 [Hyalella azteca]